MRSQLVRLPIYPSEGRAKSSFASAARLLNLRAHRNPEGSRAPFTIYSRSGLDEITTSATGKLRGICYHAGEVYFVQGTELHRTTGISSTNIGTISGSAMCDMVSAGTHVVIVDGTNEYRATSAAVAATTPPAGSWIACAYLDGYTIYARTGSDEFYVSALDDPGTVAALDFSTADAIPGDIVGLEVASRELWIFKERSTEVWYNAGNASFPFVRGNPGVIERGCGARDTIAHYGNRLFWMGDDYRIYSTQGYQPVPISNEWVEEAARAHGSALSASSGFIYAEQGQTFYVWSLWGGLSFAYNIDSGLWSEMSFPSGEAPVGSAFLPVSEHATTLVSPWFIGAADGSAGGIYLFDPDLFIDDNSPGAEATNRTIQIPALGNGGRRGILDEVYLDIEDADGGTIQLSWSDDGGSTYTSPLSADAGTRVSWTRLGSFFQRILRIRMTDNNDGCALVDAWARVRWCE